MSNKGVLWSSELVSGFSLLYLQLLVSSCILQGESKLEERMTRVIYVFFMFHITAGLHAEWTGQSWEQPLLWDLTGKNSEWSERKGWSHEVWAPQSNLSSRTACVLSVPCHRRQRAPATLKWTESKEQLIHQFSRVIIYEICRWCLKALAKSVCLLWLRITVSVCLWEVASAVDVPQNFPPIKRDITFPVFSLVQKVLCDQKRCENS